MRENCTSGSVAGAPGNRSPYAGDPAVLIEPLARAELAKAAKHGQTLRYPKNIFSKTIA